jgi:two-component system, NtrC family, sensor histidine kinase HydH
MVDIERNRRKWIYIAVIAAGIAGITVLFEVTRTSQAWWDDNIEQIYILPVIVAAIYFGWRGGLMAVGFVAICQTPLLILRPQTLLIGEAAQLANFLLAGLVTGVLADRERKHKQTLEKTTQELGVVYRELQHNFERMKRSERLYAIGQLSAGLAHEVRNPLASIEGAATILKREPHSVERNQEFLEIIQKECRRLNRMLTNFLDVARPRPPQYQMADVEQILDSVIALTAHATLDKPLTLRKLPPPEPIALECDPEQLKQVILNLVLNAIHAMPGGGEIALSANRQEDEVVIEVRDQGCGITHENLENIFDPFFTTKEDGTGLGLPVAHNIITQHGGVLTAKNNPEQGMTFSILLPAKSRRIL